MLTLASGFAPLDWGVLALYFLVLIGTGVWFARRSQRSTDDYFLGARSMPTWAVAVSVLATSLSAATFIGAPEMSYVGDLTYLTSYLGFIVAGLIVGIWFIPAFYRARVSTVYELLDQRCGRGASLGASGVFLLGRLLASGARLYIVALPAALIIFGEPRGSPPVWELVAAIGVMSIAGIVYTLAGGISSVIWSDVLQTGVFLGAVGGAIALLLLKIPVPSGEIARVLADAPIIAGDPNSGVKLTLVRMAPDPSDAYTLWSILIGFTLLGVGAFGTDQDLVQRMLTCRTSRRGSWSVISSQLASVPVVALFLLAGLLLYVYYQRPDVMGDAAPVAPGDSRKVFLSFILREMPAGMTGLMMAGLFAAGLSSLNSAINAMSSAFVGDFYRRIVPARDERHYLLVGRLGVIGWGLTLGAFAVLCVFWQSASGQTLIDFALGVMTYAYAGLIGVYFTVLFAGRGSTASVLAALGVGFIAILAMERAIWDQLVDLGELASGEHPAPWAVRADWLVSLAFTWKLAIGVTLSTAVCMLGRGKPQEPRATP